MNTEIHASFSGLTLIAVLSCLSSAVFFFVSNLLA